MDVVDNLDGKGFESVGEMAGYGLLAPQAGVEKINVKQSTASRTEQLNLSEKAGRRRTTGDCTGGLRP